MFGKKRLKQAMRAADGERGIEGTDRAEVEGFKALSEMVKSAEEADRVTVPPFDAMWNGVEDRLKVTSAPVNRESEHLGWWQSLIGNNPVLTLAPAGAILLAVVLGSLWFLQPETPSNQCFVDSYDVESGAVLIDQDFDDPKRPTVIWYVEEG